MATSCVVSSLGHVCGCSPLPASADQLPAGSSAASAVDVSRPGLRTRLRALPARGWMMRYLTGSHVFLNSSVENHSSASRRWFVVAVGWVVCRPIGVMVTPKLHAQTSWCQGAMYGRFPDDKSAESTRTLIEELSSDLSLFVYHSGFIAVVFV